MKRKYLIGLLGGLFLAFSACQPPMADLPTPTPTVQQSIAPASSHAPLVQGLHALQAHFPAPTHMRVGKHSGYLATPWGLLDTARVLRLQRDQAAPFYTFKLHNNQANHASFKRLLLYAVPGGHRALLLQYTPNAQWQVGQPFQGIMQISNLQGQALQSLALGPQLVTPYEAGAMANGRANSFEQCLDEAVYYQECENEVSTTTGLPLPEHLANCTWVLKLIYRPCHNLAGGAGPTLPSDGPPPGTFLPTNGGGSGSNGPGNSTSPEEPPTEAPPTELLTSPYGVDLMEIQHWVEAHIDYSDLPECLQNVAKDLKQVAAGPLAEMMNMFDQGLPEGFNWRVQYSIIQYNVTAYTEPLPYENCNCVITVLNADALDKATNLAIMLTLLHEMTHAYLVALRELDSTAFQENYPEILDRELDPSQTYSQNQHETLADRYHKSLAKSLKTYGDLYNYGLPLSFYKELAWEGLAGTKAFDKLSETNKRAAINTAKIEFDGTDNLGNPQTPKGQIPNCD